MHGSGCLGESGGTLVHACSVSLLRRRLGGIGLGGDFPWGERSAGAGTVQRRGGVQGTRAGTATPGVAAVPGAVLAQAVPEVGGWGCRCPPQSRHVQWGHDWGCGLRGRRHGRSHCVPCQTIERSVENPGGGSGLGLGPKAGQEHGRSSNGSKRIGRWGAMQRSNESKRGGLQGVDLALHT